MRKTALAIALCVVLILVSACSDVQREEPIEIIREKDETVETAAVQQEPEQQEIENPTAQYIRTNSPRSSDFPSHILVSSLEELYAYYQQNKQKVTLWHKEALYYDTTIGFIDAVERYDEKFFEENALILAFKSEPSGSIHHHVTRIFILNDVLNVEIDVLRPEAQTADVGEWIIMAQVPKSFAQTSGIEVFFRNKDYIPPQNEYIDKGDIVEFVSGKNKVRPYEQTLWSATTNTQTGETVETETMVSSLEETVSVVPKIILERNLELPVQMHRLENIVIYDEQLREIAWPQELSIGTFVILGSGTYYTSMEILWHGEYDDVNKIKVKYKRIYYVKFILPEQDYGMAEQLSDMGGFAWSDIDKISAQTTANNEDGTPSVIDWDEGFDGVSRMITFLREQDKLTEVPMPDIADWKQRIVFFRESEELMSISACENGLYVVTQGTGYAYQSPPWLFEMLVEAAANGRFIPFDDAVNIAWRRVSSSSYEQYVAGKSAVFGYLQRGSYNTIEWVIIFSAKEDGMTRVKVKVQDYHFNRIQEIE